MPPKLAAIKLEDGKQLHLGSWYKPEELLARLRQPSQLKEAKQRYDIIIAEELPGKPCAPWEGCAWHGTEFNLQEAVSRLSGASTGVIQEELDALQGGQPWSSGMKRAAEAGSKRDPPATTSQRSRFWEAAKEFAPAIAKAAVKLLSMHAPTAAAERNWSAWSRLYKDALRNRLKVHQAEKLVYIKANLGDQEKQSDAVLLQMDALD